MQNRYELKLVDSNEASNIYTYANSVDIFFDTNNLQTEKNCQNKLLILCSDEEIKDNDFIYIEYYPMIGGLKKELLRFNNHNDYNSLYKKKVIATNSPTLTPNCYISEDRVKEFVEYWNKWKELPKFKIEKLIINGKGKGKRETNILKITNNQLLIKWLPKEEECERGITITSSSRKIDNCRHFDKEIGCVKDDCSCEKEQPKQPNLEQELNDAAEKEAKGYYQNELVYFMFRKGATSDIAKKLHQKGMFTEAQILKLLRFVALNYWLDRGTNEYVIVDIKEEKQTETQILETFLNQ